MNKRGFVFLFLFLQACSAATTSSSGGCETSGASGSVASNHGHSVDRIPWSDIDTAVQKSYSLYAGTAGHAHTVTVSAPDMASMKSGNAAISVSTNGDSSGHSHTVTFVCSH